MIIPAWVITKPTCRRFHGHRVSAAAATLIANSANSPLNHQLRYTTAAATRALSCDSRNVPMAIATARDAKTTTASLSEPKNFKSGCCIKTYEYLTTAKERSQAFGSAHTLAKCL